MAIKRKRFACSAFNEDGLRCHKTAANEDDYCHIHARLAERRQKLIDDGRVPADTIWPHQTGKSHPDA